MSYPQALKHKAIKMREQGFSLKEIMRQLNIAKSTTSLWISKVPLPKAIADLLEKKEMTGRQKGLAVIAAKRKLAQIGYEKEAEALIRESWSTQDKKLARLLCASLFWCEGSKRITDVRFTNSDPGLVRFFLQTFRKGFEIDESKWRALIHLHDYHPVYKQSLLWSKITGIPLYQFTKPYIKAHTGVRKRLDYPGCISIRYGDAKIAKRLSAMYHCLARQTVTGA